MISTSYSDLIKARGEKPAEVEVLLYDAIEMTQKPSGMIIGEISNYLARSEGVLIPVEFLAMALVAPYGYTFCPAMCRPVTERGLIDKNWKSQQVFAIDIDQNLPFEDAKNRWERYGIPPAFAYTTFSDTDRTKYRIVFVMDSAVTDIKLRKGIMESFGRLYPEMDRKTFNPARMFFGGKELIYTDDANDYRSTVRIKDLPEMVGWFMSERDRKNSKRNISAYEIKADSLLSHCQQLNPGRTFLEATTPPLDRVGKNEANATTSIIYNKNRDEIFNFSITDCELTRDTPTLFNGGEQGSMSDGSSYNENKLRNVSLEQLKEGCHLFKEFYSGERWCYHEELFGLATNLLSFMGGRTWFLTGLESRSEYSALEGGFKLDQFKNHGLLNIEKKGYAPQRCENYCPYNRECRHTETILTTAYFSRGTVRVFDPVAYITMDEAEAQLERIFNDCLSADADGTMHVIHADAGLGKTEMYVKAKNLCVDVIALPTHELKEEISKRMEAAGMHVFTVPEIPDLGIYRQRYMELHAMGAFEQASQLLYSIKKEIPAVIGYLKELDKAKDMKDVIILTTHDRVVADGSFSNKTILFDEDPMSCLVRKSSMSIRDLGLIEDILDRSSEVNGDAYEARTYINELATFLKTAESNKLIQGPNQAFPHLKELKTFVANELLREKKGRARFRKEGYDNSNVFEFFNCEWFIKNEDGSSIDYITKREFGFKKAIVLSATSNKIYYEGIFKEKLMFHEVGRVKHMGRIVQYPQHSFSKSVMLNNPEYIALLKHVAGSNPIITYKVLEKCFPENTVLTFGNSTGTDQLNGKDITVAGTYRFSETSYFLDAAILGIECNPRKEQMKFMPIEYDGRQFYFYTYRDNEKLRNLMLSNIESELDQAVGRARIIRNDCTVTVLSNLPLNGAVFRPLTDEMESILADCKEMDEIENTQERAV